MRKTKNDVLLSDYFKNQMIINKKIPSIEEISKRTGISPATISRFARRKGFLNFFDLKLNFNKNINSFKNNNNFIEIFNEVVNNKFVNKIIISPSRFTKPIGELIYQRLKEITKKKIYLYNSDDFDVSKVKRDCFYIFTSISGKTKHFEEFSNKNKGDFYSLLISYKKYSERNKKNLFISLDWKIPSSRSDEFILVDDMYKIISSILLNLYLSKDKK